MTYTNEELTAKVYSDAELAAFDWVPHVNGDPTMQSNPFKSVMDHPVGAQNLSNWSRLEMARGSDDGVDTDPLDALLARISDRDLPFEFQRYRNPRTGETGALVMFPKPFVTGPWASGRADPADDPNISVEDMETAYRTRARELEWEETVSLPMHRAQQHYHVDEETSELYLTRDSERNDGPREFHEVEAERKVLEAARAERKRKADEARAKVEAETGRQIVNPDEVQRQKVEEETKHHLKSGKVTPKKPPTAAQESSEPGEQPSEKPTIINPWALR